MITDDLERTMAAHYGRKNLLDSLDSGLKSLGHDANSPTVEALSSVDEFHTAGRMATLKALSLIELDAQMSILDAGCGIGGTARHIAVNHRCHVTGLDVTPEYIEVASVLSDRMDLNHLCDFQIGSVLDMPFVNTKFDAAVTFHVAMNIENREGFYGELYRVLRPSAQLCIFDVMKSSSHGMVYPVPWAQNEEMSFLITLEKTVGLLHDAGFKTELYQSYRRTAVNYYRVGIAKTDRENDQPALGLHLLTGCNAREKLLNYVSALEQDQIDPVFIVARRE